VPICSKIGSFPKYRVVHEISNRRTDERTDGQVENIMTPASRLVAEE